MEVRGAAGNPSPDPAFPFCAGKSYPAVGVFALQDFASLLHPPPSLQQPLPLAMLLHLLLPLILFSTRFPAPGAGALWRLGLARPSPRCRTAASCADLIRALRCFGGRRIVRTPNGMAANKNDHVKGARQTLLATIGKTVTEPVLNVGLRAIMALLRLTSSAIPYLTYCLFLLGKGGEGGSIFSCAICTEMASKNACFAVYLTTWKMKATSEE